MVKTLEGSWHQGAGGHSGKKWTRQGLHPRFHWGLGCDPNSPKSQPWRNMSGALRRQKHGAQGGQKVGKETVGLRLDCGFF